MIKWNFRLNSFIAAGSNFNGTSRRTNRIFSIVARIRLSAVSTTRVSCDLVTFAPSRQPIPPTRFVDSGKFHRWRIHSLKSFACKYRGRNYTEFHWKAVKFLYTGYRSRSRLVGEISNGFLLPFPFRFDRSLLLRHCITLFVLEATQVLKISSSFRLSFTYHFLSFLLFVSFFLILLNSYSPYISSFFGFFHFFRLRSLIFFSSFFSFYLLPLKLHLSPRYLKRIVRFYERFHAKNIIRKQMADV